MPSSQGDPPSAAQQSSKFQIFALACDEHDAVLFFACLLAIAVLPAMRFLVTGANGLVGRFLCAELFRRGGKVRAAVRSANAEFDDFERTIVGSINGAT